VIDIIITLLNKMSTIKELDNNYSTIIMIASLRKGRHFIIKKEPKSVHN
jgi:hypothetical protein